MATAKKLEIQVTEPQKPVVSKVQRAAALYAFLSGIQKTSYDRDDLPDNAHHEVSATLAAEIDGEQFVAHYTGSVDVGETATRASSSGFDAAELVAWLLAQTNEVTRNKKLREAADVFVENDGHFPVDAKELEHTKEMLKSIRTKVPKTVRGSVKIKAEMCSQPQLKVTQ